MKQQTMRRHYFATNDGGKRAAYYSMYVYTRVVKVTERFDLFVFLSFSLHLRLFPA